MTAQLPTKDESNFNHSGPPPAPPPPRRTWPERIMAWSWLRRHLTLTALLALIWVGLARWLDPGKFFNFGIMLVVVLGVVLLLILFAVLRWRGSAHSLQSAATLAGPVLIWLAALLLLALVFGFWDWTEYAVGGAVLIVALGIGLLLAPGWWVVLSSGDIYYVRRWRAPAHQFSLVTYGGPLVNPAVIDRLIELGIPRDDLTRFLEYGGIEVGLRRLRMTFTHDPVTHAELPPESQNRDGLTWLEELHRQVEDPARQRETVIWFAPVDHVWRLWNRRETVNVQRDITGLVTRDAGSLEIELQFICEFNPMTVTAVDFYLGLSNRRSVQAVKDVVQAIMGRGAERAALGFFVGRSFEDSLTDAAIGDFKQHLFDSLEWAAVYLGISIETFSFQCRPLVPYPVAQAQQRRLASRAQTDAEYYKIDALIRQAQATGVSLDMINRLQYLIQVDTLHRPPQDLFGRVVPSPGPAARVFSSAPGALAGGPLASGPADGAPSPAPGATGGDTRHFDRSIDYDAIPLFRDEDGVYRPGPKG